MRRALALLLALALLGTAGFSYAHRAVGASAEAVEMRETVLCGDSAAARGIAARLPLYCGGHLFWDLEAETRADGAAVTEFRYSAGREYPRGEGEYSGLSVYVMTNIGVGGNFGRDFDFDDYYGGFEDGYYDVYGELLRDVASRTKAGEEHSEYAELSDWVDCLPLQFDLVLEGYIYVYDDGEESIETNRGSTYPLGRKLAEYFRIPWSGPAPLKVSVGRNVDGEIVEWNISSVYRDELEGVDDASANTWEGLNVGCLSTVTEDACYFVFDEWSSERGTGRVDFSALPGGRGVYRLPIGTAEDTTRVYLDAIEAVMPVADGEYVELLESDGERLLLFTVGDGKLYLTQAPLSNLADMRKTELTELVELEYRDDGCDRVTSAQGLYCVETLGGRMLLLESVNGGEYELVLDVARDFPGAEESVWTMLRQEGFRESYDNYSTTLLWDGERFAMARWCGKESSGFYGEAAGFVLWVYDETGLLYSGVYESSLSRSPTELYNNVIRSAGGLELAWK